MFDRPGEKLEPLQDTRPVFRHPAARVGRSGRAPSDRQIGKADTGTASAPEEPTRKGDTPPGRLRVSRATHSKCPDRCRMRDPGRPVRCSRHPRASHAQERCPSADPDALRTTRRRPTPGGERAPEDRRLRWDGIWALLRNGGTPASPNWGEIKLIQTPWLSLTPARRGGRKSMAARKKIRTARTGGRRSGSLRSRPG